MTTRVQVRLHDGFATVTRLVARLHAVGVAINEMHACDNKMCVHLATAADERRVRTVLERCADAAVVDYPGPCYPLSGSESDVRTTYVVWQETLAEYEARRQRIGSVKGHSPAASTF